MGEWRFSSTSSSSVVAAAAAAVAVADGITGIDRQLRQSCYGVRAIDGVELSREDGGARPYARAARAGHWRSSGRASDQGRVTFTPIAATVAVLSVRFGRPPV